MTIKMAIACRIGLLLSLLVWGGCVSRSPPIRYFLLTPMASGVVSASPANGVLRHIVVEPVKLPPYLNRTQIVTRGSTNHLILSHFKHWGDNLQANISRVMLENLSTLLGTDHISSPTTLTYDRPTLRIISHVQQFEQSADDTVILKTRWHLLDSQTGKTLRMQQSQFVSAPISRTDYDGIAASMSTLLLRWGQEMAREIMALPP